ncbi:MAG: substrate-binding domain-containing protein [Sedimentisphaerales bacterium]|nr:substrate-binding domain-containing protein [Sedimentisphaerales bacterium]
MPKKTSRYTRTPLLLSMIAASFLPALIGCGKKEPAGKTELVLLCGSSFVKPAEQICTRFTEKTGIKITATVAGSEDFLPHVKAADQGDILITHDPYLDYTRDANALLDSVQVGFVAPVLAVQTGNPKGIKSIDDLAKPGLKVALTDPKYSTCGEMVFALLEKKGLKEAILKNVENRLTKGHSTLGTYLKTQTVDAVIMWNGVADTFKDSLDVIRTPYEYEEEIRVHIIGLSYTKHPDELKKFIEFVRRDAMAVFAEHGYVK